MEYLKKIIQQYHTKLYILSDQAVVSGANFLLSILIVRLLGIEIFGELSVVLIVLLAIQAVNQALISSPMQSLFYATTAKQYIKKVKGLQVAMVLLLIALAYFSYMVMSFIDSEKFHVSIAAVLIYTIGLILFDFNRKHLYIKGKYLFSFIKDALTMGGQLLAVFVLANYGEEKDLSALLWELGLCFWLIEIPFFIFYQTPSFPKLKQVKEHWEYGKWLLGNAILQWFSGNFYITIGAAILGAEVAGVIRIGQSIIGVWNIIIQALENYIPPKVAKLYSTDGYAGLVKYLFRLTFKGGVLALLVAGVLVVLRNQIWELFYGSELLHFSYILFWFAPILFFNFLGTPFRFAIRTIHRTKILFEAYIFSSLFGFATAHYFVYQFNIHGICLGLLLTQIIMQLWYLYRLAQFSKHENHSYSTR